ncbi:prenyltransferase/squalene oxidase repeat-containing protein [Zavarzinella formosa]|uniref:prenyltransferase/squalene oxidase repeat-containing protein n=1 Tax=Zavarzinella formosa TaxID=360055 RepID=UPI0002F62738|nr:prenyltransferase/squalene oxidase repeat-containing protein [Zavarzinella formosa]
MNADRLNRAYAIARDELLRQRIPGGWWEGELSASALSTATALMAFRQANVTEPDRITRGLDWLLSHQNADGGWGDTVQSFSNISTTMLCRAVLEIHADHPGVAGATAKCNAWLKPHGNTPLELAEAIRKRYGRDRTFSVPILMMCALAGLVPWNEVPRLPFEMAALPQSWYRFARLPVVSYALPALIAIGQVVHRHRSKWNLFTAIPRLFTKAVTLRVLERMQPSSGGYLEATPLTSFVVMSLATVEAKWGLADDAGRRVIASGLKFIRDSQQPDGSWPIDTNLSVWLTTLSVNALAAGNDLDSLPERDKLLKWLLDQQTKIQHPFTGAAPGAWGWSDRPGSVPDCDDTPGAVLAVGNLGKNNRDTCEAAIRWMFDLQNGDGGWPTFCKGWGKLPFDRSGSDLTAHVLRAVHATGHASPEWDRRRERGFNYLRKQQRPDGSWLPLWFGNQHAPDDINPVYGTVRVLAAYRDLKRADSTECRRGVGYLLKAQHLDGSWGGDIGGPPSVEETAIAVEVLLELATPEQLPNVTRGLEWLIARVEAGTWTKPSPIGFYFAKLWYFEKLYPVIFTVAALGKVVSMKK